MSFIDALVDQEANYTNVPCIANQQILVQLGTWFNSRLNGPRCHKLSLTL